MGEVSAASYSNITQHADRSVVVTRKGLTGHTGQGGVQKDMCPGSAQL